MFFNSKGRRKKEPMDIDITSLLDVLVILLVFLLKSYNASDLKLNLVKNLELPDSATRRLGNHAIVVQVDTDRNLFVNNTKIGTVSSASSHPILLEKLKEMKKNARTPAEQKAKNINLVFDEGLPYKIMKGIMHTSAIAGYTEFKFIVQGNF